MIAKYELSTKDPKRDRVLTKGLSIDYAHAKMFSGKIQIAKKILLIYLLLNCFTNILATMGGLSVDELVKGLEFFADISITSRVR